MGEMVETATRAGIAPRSRGGRFDQVSIAFHWLTLALVAGQLATAFLLITASDGAAALLTIHRSMGVVAWMVVAGRLGWRASGAARLPPFPASMPRLQQLIARLNEYGLYALLLAQPLTGLGDTVFRGHPFTLAVWRLPALVHANKPAFHAFHAAHELGAIALLALIALHAAAALLHGVVLRDGVLERMWPWTAR